MKTNFKKLQQALKRNLIIFYTTFICFIAEIFKLLYHIVTQKDSITILIDIFFLCLFGYFSIYFFDYTKKLKQLIKNGEFE